MFRFEHPEYLFLLVLLPVLLGLFLVMWRFRKRAIQRFGNASLISRLMPEMAGYKHVLKLIFLLLAVLFIIIGSANPQWGTKKEVVSRKGLDVFLALDISQSMMAEDIAPNRLERAKRFVQNLIDELEGERIGFIVFAGSAYLQVPLTTDYAALEIFVKSASPNLAGVQGTLIADAIQVAESSFEVENKNHKALILITDGENHEEEAVARAVAAHENGLVIHTVGVGTEEGSFIPVVISGRPDYKRDDTGNPVRSALNTAMLKELADSGGGASFNLSSGSQAVSTALKERIDAIEKREFEQRMFTDYESHFQLFIAFGILFLILEFLLSYKRNKFLEGKDIFRI